MNKKKKTAKWCKGKVGIEHVTEIVINHNFNGKLRVCDWRRIWTRRGGVVQLWRWQYSCVHARKCVNCGKYVDWRVDPEECPGYKPQVD